MIDTKNLEKRASTRMAMRFTWEKVDASLIRRILVSAYVSNKQPVDAAKVGGLDEGRLRDEVTRVLGRPLNAKHIDSVIDVLRSDWLPTLTYKPLAEFILKVQLGLSGSERTERPSSMAECLAFLQRRNKTVNFKAQLRTFFLKEHRAPFPVESSGLVTAIRPTWPISLAGAGQIDNRTPFDLQSDVWEALNKLERAGEPQSGLMVLPTGAGKTYTMVHWLLERMVARPDLRVLWMADRKELIDQAARTFVDLAATMEPGFSRRLRAMHSGAGLATGLADPELDVAVVTRQTLLAGFDGMGRKKLHLFLSRPTVVVVDEAHHAVAAGYDKLLTEISNTANVMLVGMTATPWPSGYGAIAQLLKRFPVPLGEVSVRELIDKGVLARPIFHSVETNVSVQLEKAELTSAVQHDLPQSVLKRLDREGRNHSIFHAWWNHREEWGKTLIFAVNIHHANTLGDLFSKHGARVKVLTCETTEPGVLDWFREATGAVALISVGMLTEGVDVPDARTAFLARPTSSRIRMRQMIGRVLRGTVAGGDPIANADFRVTSLN